MSTLMDKFKKKVRVEAEEVQAPSPQPTPLASVKQQIAVDTAAVYTPEVETAVLSFVDRNPSELSAYLNGLQLGLADEELQKPLMRLSQDPFWGPFQQFFASNFREVLDVVASRLQYISQLQAAQQAPAEQQEEDSLVDKMQAQIENAHEPQQPVHHQSTNVPVPTNEELMQDAVLVALLCKQAEQMLYNHKGLVDQMGTFLQFCAHTGITKRDVPQINELARILMPESDQ